MVVERLKTTFEPSKGKFNDWTTLLKWSYATLPTITKIFGLLLKRESTEKKIKVNSLSPTIKLAMNNRRHIVGFRTKDLSSNCFELPSPWTSSNKIEEPINSIISLALNQINACHKGKNGGEENKIIPNIANHSKCYFFQFQGSSPPSPKPPKYSSYSSSTLLASSFTTLSGDNHIDELF
ncbi:hypothetical protein ACTA71_011286 [Dictyostelium dimigraforme]